MILAINEVFSLSMFCHWYDFLGKLFLGWLQLSL